MFQMEVDVLFCIAFLCLKFRLQSAIFVSIICQVCDGNLKLDTEVGEHIKLIYVQYRKIPDRISEIIVFFPRL